MINICNLVNQLPKTNTAVASFLKRLATVVCSLSSRVQTISDNVGPKLYYSWIAQVNQNSTSAPEVHVLRDEIKTKLGLTTDIVWSRSSAGNYTGTRVDGFPAGTCQILIAPPQYYIAGGGFNANDDDVVYIQTTDPAADTTDSDGVLQNTLVEIRYYPSATPF